MELDRRKFIRMIFGGAAGGAAGIGLTPLPWKLTDDISIWTQTWPWVPEPSVGAFSNEKSVCTLCPGGCGIEVRKVDKRAVKIEGRTDYPINPGGICPVGAGGLQLLYNEQIRYTSPMKRVGPRGAGKFREISWDEALNELKARVKGLRKQGQPEDLCAVDGNPVMTSMSLLIRRLLEAVGSPNYVRIPTVEDTYGMVNTLMQGSEGPMAYDLENSDFILSFGCGLIDGWGAPGRIINAWGLWHSDPLKKKVKIVQIESRASNTASKANQWVAPKPGTEAALALGLAHVIIREGPYDTKFVKDHTSGFAKFEKLLLNKYNPEKVAKITGLKLMDIVSLAREFARAKAPVALFGKGKGGLNGSLYEFMAVHCLNALVGNINRPGGVLVHDPLPLKPWPDVKLDAIAQGGLGKARLDMAGSKRYPFTQSLINNTFEAIFKSPKSPVDTLLVFSANPAYTLPDCGSFIKAMKKVPYIVSFSPFKDETSFMADLIMPDHTCLEKMDDIVWPTGLQYPVYGLSRPVVEPLYDTRHSGDVIIKLAGMIGGTVGSSFPWKNFEESVKARAEGLFQAGGGLTGYDESEPVWKALAAGGPVKPDYKSFSDMWKKIKSGGLWYRPTHKFKYRESLGKFEFYSTKIEQAVNELSKGGSLKNALQKMGINADSDEAFMPHYEGASTSVDEDKYPLVMVPYELINLSSGWLPNPPYANKILFDHQLRKNESFAEINPKTAAEYKLKEGDRVIIKSGKGRLQVRVHLFEGAMPGVVYLPLGLGHSAYDEYQRGKGVNPNDIIDGGRDPFSGQSVWWNTPVALRKV